MKTIVDLFLGEGSKWCLEGLVSIVLSEGNTVCKCCTAELYLWDSSYLAKSLPC